MPDGSRAAKNLASYLSAPDSLALPELVETAEAARQILDLYEESGREGATFSLRFGDMRDQELYAVSVYPERGRKSAGGTVSLHILELFIRENIDLLRDPRCSIGLWYNADEDVTYRDITATLPGKNEATLLAHEYDQIAIFDLLALTEIETGGTGNSPGNMLPATKRLPNIFLRKEAQEEEQL